MDNQKVLADYHQIILALHEHLQRINRFPHVGQFPVLKAFFQDRKKIIMAQNGRSAGKTEQVLYIAWRYALTYSNSEIYIICPEIKQAKKIYWLPRRLQNYGPQEFILEHRDSELRTVFKNGSYIILDGCENFDSMRGIKPNLVVYDEFQHHTQFFDEEVMQPNLASGKVSLVVMGTPPKRICYYTEFREHHLEGILSGDTSRFYVELPSEVNPTLDKNWLAKKRQELIKRDKYNVWLREYEGKQVFDTESAVFPFFKQDMIYDHQSLLDTIQRDKRKLQYYAIFDPGTTSVFAVLFAAINPYTSQIFILDEIYATEKHEMTATKIWARAKAKMDAIYDNEDKWYCYYDEAAAWFANELSVGLIPTKKHKSQQRRSEEDGRPGESILNTLMLEKNRFIVSDNCPKFVWELENYVLDEDGRYPRTADHLMDCLTYLIHCSNFELSTELDNVAELEGMERKRLKTPMDLFRDMKVRNNLSEALEVDYYDQESMDDIWQH